MSDIGNTEETEKYKFIWTPAPRDVPELEFKEMTIDKLIKHRENNKNEYN